jgi:uncharacterized protein (DUF1778 family)
MDLAAHNGVEPTNNHAERSLRSAVVEPAGPASAQPACAPDRWSLGTLGPLPLEPRDLAAYVLTLYTGRMASAQTARQGRINMRVNEHQERVLRAAADLSGETLTGFVLSVATERAEQVLERAQRIDLNAEAFQRFVAAVDGPIEEMPILRRYASTKSPIPLR